jgi:hypothetical protein
MTLLNDPNAPSHADPSAPSAAPQAAPAADAIAAALANRETVMRSLEERRAPGLHPSRRPEAGGAGCPAEGQGYARRGPIQEPDGGRVGGECPPAADGSRVARKGGNELHRQLGETLAALCPIPATAGESAERDRNQSAQRAAAIIVDLVAEEVERRLRG